MYFISFLLFAFFGFSSMTTASPADVSVVGEMRKVMKDDDRSAHITLDELNRKHVYALGPVEGLNGEITIIDGQLFISHITKDREIVFTDLWTTKAAFLVSSHVSKWKKIQIPATVRTLTDLEEFIEISLKKNGLDSEKAHPFLVQGNFGTVKFHIVNGIDGTGKRLDKVERVEFHENNAKGKLVGFFSKHHQGVFTHQGSSTHIHFVSSSKKQAGHVQELELASGCTLHLPK